MPRVAHQPFEGCLVYRLRVPAEAANVLGSFSHHCNEVTQANTVGRQRGQNFSIASCNMAWASHHRTPSSGRIPWKILATPKGNVIIYEHCAARRRTQNVIFGKFPHVCSSEFDFRDLKKIHEQGIFGIKTSIIEEALPTFRPIGFGGYSGASAQDDPALLVDLEEG